jgi:NADPH-dependent F420 reductase
MTVAVLGTGQMGAALCRRLATAGVPVVVGSREAARARALAARIADGASTLVEGATHHEAIGASEVVVLAIPFEDVPRVVGEALELLPGRIVVDPTTPWGEHVPPTSGAETIAKLLPAGAPLVAAWKTTFADELALAASAEGHDVFLCGDDAPAKRTIAEMVVRTGFRPLDCGGLEHARTLEGMTRLMGPIAKGLGLQAGSVPAFRLAVHRIDSG